MSVVLRPQAPACSAAGLTAIAALAVAEAIEAVSGLRAALDWPNDVTIAQRKVAGVLVERRGERLSPCVLGVGVNVNTRREEFEPPLRSTATSLALEAGREFPREELAAAILSRLRSRYDELASGGRDEVAAQWLKRCSLVGREATVRADGSSFHGTIVSVDPLSSFHGTIVSVDPLDGIVVELASGERREFAPEKATLEVEDRR